MADAVSIPCLVCTFTEDSGVHLKLTDCLGCGAPAEHHEYVPNPIAKVEALAPELLEALEDLLEYHLDSWDENDPPTPSVVTNARRLIRKARAYDRTR